MFLIQNRRVRRQTSQPNSKQVVQSATKATRLVGAEGPKNLPPISIEKWIFDHLIKYQDKSLIIDAETGEEWNGKQIHDYAYNCAIALIEKYCLETGDSVCFFAPTQPKYIIGVIAVWTAGGVFTGCDSTFPESELSNVVEDTNARYIITSKENEAIARSVATKFGSSQIKHVITLDDLEQCFAFYQNEIYYSTHYDSNNEQLPNIASKNLSAVMFTSGTTGRPKPIIRGHLDLIYVSMELQDPDLLGVEPNDCVAFNIPIFHSAGLYYLLHFLIAGCKMICFSGYDELKFLSYVQNYRITIAFLLHSNLTHLVTSSKNTDNFDLSSLKEVFYDGANLKEGIATAAINKLSLQHIRQIAGQSEIGWIALFPRSLSIAETKSCGLPAPGIVIKVVDIESGNLLEPHKIGEIRVKSKHCATGYHNRPKQLTDNLFDSEGYIRTGDAGYYDHNGYLYYIDRLCFLIKVDGHIVIASYLEELIKTHPSVGEVAVVPVKCDKFGQIPKAFITLKSNHNDVNEHTIIDYVEKRVDKAYKQLRGGVVILSEMPISPNGRGRIRKGVLMLKYCQE